MVSNCVFCKIATGKIPTQKISESEHAFVIADLFPQAPKRFLVIPKNHISSMSELFEKSSQAKVVIGQLFELGNRVAKEQGLLPGGYRSMINTGKDAGQTVFHLHLHIMGGGTLPEKLT